MFQIFAHADLSHEFVLVSIHSSELANVGKSVLQTIRQLESVHITQSILHVRVNHKLGQAEDFSAQMEGVTES